MPEGRGAGWEAMRQVLARVAVGPSGSRDLTREAAREALRLCLAREASDVQIGVLLIALRLKRETDEENLGALDALRDASHVVRGPAPEVACLADPFDGYARTPHFAPAAAATLAACGLPTYLQGGRSVPPKHGVTHRQVLEAMGIRLDVGRGAEGVEAAARRLAERGVAWVDVEDFCPPLHALTPLREEIAKRPLLATLEKLVVPLRGAEATHVASGWVHPGYERLMALLLREAGATSALLVRAREGAVDPHLHRDTEVRGWRADGAPLASPIQPKGLGMQWADPPDEQPITAAAMAERQVAALHRKQRTADGLTVRLLAGMVLHQAGRASTVMRGIGLAHEAITSGRARAVLQEGFGP